MVASGAVKPTDLAWHEGLPEWKPLNAILSFTPVAPPPPTPVVGAAPLTAPGKKRSSCIGCLGLTVLFGIAGAVIIAICYNGETPDQPVVSSPAPTPKTTQPADDDVTKVKNGTLGFDKSVQVGPALEGYSCFKKVIWRSFNTPQGRTIIEAIATVDIGTYKNTQNDEAIPIGWGGSIIPAGNVLASESLDKLTKAFKSIELTYTAQFQLSKTDETFDVAYSGYMLKTTKLDGANPVEQEVKDDQEQNSLRSIFSNKPDQKIVALLMTLSQDIIVPTPPTAAPTSTSPTNQ